MKKISKGSSPDFFEAWKRAFTSREGRHPCYDDLVGEPKQDLKLLLMDEQGSLCCYCMRHIESYNSHIEHFRPKGDIRYKGRDLDYLNLFISCNGYKETRVSCGHCKDLWFDEFLMVSPTEDTVETLFTYTADGAIGFTDTRTQETINHLGLNEYNLVRQRKTAIYVSGLFDDDFSEMKDSLTCLFQEKDKNGNFLPFCTAVLFCITNT